MIHLLNHGLNDRMHISVLMYKSKYKSLGVDTAALQAREKCLRKK